MGFVVQGSVVRREVIVVSPEYGLGMDLRVRVWGLGIGFTSLGFRAQGLAVRQVVTEVPTDEELVWGLGVRVWGLGFRGWEFGFGFGFGNSGVGFRVERLGVRV